MSAARVASASAERVRILVRSNDARSVNVIVSRSSTVVDLRKKIAHQLGFPISSAGCMRLVVRSTSTAIQMPVGDESVTLGDLVMATRDHTGSLGMVVENGTSLAPKLAFDIGQILKHWLSPAFASNPAYRAALLALKEVAGLVLADTSLLHNFAAILTMRVFSRVTRGLELLKKLGFSVSATSIHAGPRTDLRLFEVVNDHVQNISSAAAERSPPSARRTLRAAATQRRHRRLQEMIELGYEFLIRLENVRIRLDENILAAIPRQEIDERTLEVMRSNGDSDCTICLEEFSIGMPIIRLPCLHVYHEQCATNWFQRSRRCPNDMLEVTSDSKRI